MKNSNLLGGAMMILSAAFIISCNKIMEYSSPVRESGEDCRLTVSIGRAPTKVVGQTNADEDAISNVTIFVFKTDEGAGLDACSYASGGTLNSVTLNCTLGKRKIYVLANTAEDFTGSVHCEADLLKGSTLLKDNGMSNFFMMGSKETSIEEAACEVKIEVSRFVSSVRLEKITNLMEAKVYRGDGCFVVNGIYLTNVVGKMNFNKVHDPASLGSEFWHARLNAEANPLFYDGGIDAKVNYGEGNARSVTHTFYAFPNNCEVKESSTWSQRSTMLVVEASLSGEKCFYPVAVGPLEANKQYVITNFTVRRPGTLHPWETIHKSEASIEIEVVPWGTSVTTTEDM